MVDDRLALGRDLHLDHRVVEQVAPVVRRCRPHVVRCPEREQLHRDEAHVGVDEQLADMREVGHGAAEQPAVARVVDRLVEGVGADADRGPAEVELADVDGVERGVPGLAAAREDVGVRDRVVVQRKLGDVVLRVADVLDALVLLVARIDDEEHVVVGVADPAEGRDQGRLVAVADVVLAAAGEVGAVRLRHQRHLGRVDVGAVLLLRQAEREDMPLAQQPGGLLFDGLVVRDPDRAEPEHGHLPRVPVGEAVEAEYFVEFAVSPAVPAHAFGAVRIGRRRHQLGKDLLPCDELQEVGVPGALVVVFLDALEPLVLEELDGLAHDFGRGLVRIRAIVLLRIE